MSSPILLLGMDVNGKKRRVRDCSYEIEGRSVSYWTARRFQKKAKLDMIESHNEAVNLIV